MTFALVATKTEVPYSGISVRVCANRTSSLVKSGPAIMLPPVYSCCFVFSASVSCSTRIDVEKSWTGLFSSY